MYNKSLFIVFVLVMCESLWSQRQEFDVEYAFNTAQKYHYTNRDSAYHYYEKTISLAHKQNNLDYLFMGYTYLINANGYYYDLTNYRKNIEREDQVLHTDTRVDDFEWADYYRNYMLFDKGNYYYKTKNYSTSKKYFLELYAKLEAIEARDLFVEDIEMLSSINSFLGLINYHTGKFELAEYIYRRDIDLVTKHADSLANWQSSIVSSKKLLSQVYEVQNKPGEAGLLLQEALSFYSDRAKDPSNKNSYLAILMLFAKNCNKQAQYQKALDQLKQKERFGENPFLHEMYFITGDAYQGLAKTEQALEQYKLGLAKTIAYRKDQPHQDVAKAFGKMVEFYLSEGSYTVAKQHLISAFNASGDGISISSIQENPGPQKVFSKRQLLYLLDLKLQLLTATFSKNNEEANLNLAVATSQDILATFDLLKKEFDSKLDKQFLAETAYPIFHRMFERTYEAYRENPSDDLLELAITISEKNKDFLLMEALRSTQASKYANIPQEVLDKEARLRAEITHLEKEIFDASDANDVFTEELLTVKQRYYSFLDSVKVAFPKYHNLKYETRTIDLETIRQQLLDDKGTLLSYTLTEKYLYAIVVNHATEKFLKISFSDANRQQVLDFYKLLSKPSLGASKTSISSQGKALYEKLLKIPLKDFDAEHLTIVPDGELHYLPFDLLTKGENFLLEDTNVSYGNSIASLIQLKRKPNQVKNNVLAFAPSFKGLSEKMPEREFGKLLYNDDEVAEIQSYFDTAVYADSSATLANFMNHAPSKSIIHLATHASANDAFPDYSYLAFSDTAEEDHILYIKDLYNMSLHTEMVTLSACQTGIGKLRKGQGMLSLSKGFYYAGAKSLVNTLWKINDKSTVQLMHYFYDNLSKGDSKSAALRKAKLKYLATTDDELLKHPYYWAAFVVSGDVRPVSNESTIFWVVFFGTAALLLVSLFSARSKNSKTIQLRR